MFVAVAVVVVVVVTVRSIIVLLCLAVLYFFTPIFNAILKRGQSNYYK